MSLPKSIDNSRFGWYFPVFIHFPDQENVIS